MNSADPRNGALELGQMKLDQVAKVLRENQKLISLGRLAASIAHEINNPLESITNLLYLMEPDMPEKSSAYLKLAQRELSRVVQISKQTLTFSRETKALVRVQLAELIEEVLALHNRRVSDKNLRVVRQYETTEPVTVFPGEMRQVLSNLISNAIEATAPRGRIVIRIRAARRWSGRGTRGLRVSIGDNGTGIPASLRRRLGEPFFTTKGQGGTGLGLWVTNSILKRYGGNMQLRSSISPVRHGTVFSLFLPSAMNSVAIFPGGEAEHPAASGTNIPRWHGLRLIRQEHDPEIQAEDYVADPSHKPSSDPHLRATGN